MRRFFKPLTKRDAKYCAIVVTIILLWMIYEAVKDLMGGASFDDLHSQLLFILFFAIIDFGMFTILSKDGESEEQEKDAAQKLEDQYTEKEEFDAEEAFRDEAEKLAEKYGDQSDNNG